MVALRDENLDENHRNRNGIGIALIAFVSLTVPVVCFYIWRPLIPIIVSKRREQRSLKEMDRASATTIQAAWRERQVHWVVRARLWRVQLVYHQAAVGEAFLAERGDQLLSLCHMPADA